MEDRIFENKYQKEKYLLLTFSCRDTIIRTSDIERLLLKRKENMMPPKAKFTKQEIVDAALQLFREGGLESLTSRNLGKKLGSSACPIFTVFSSMEEVQTAMIESAKAIYKSYVEKGLTQEIPFRGVGAQYIQFAMDEPKLFHLLFMNETKDAPSVNCVLMLLDESYDIILQSIMASFSIDRQTAEQLYRHLWIYTHGIACLCATRTCQFTQQETQSMMTEVFLSLLKNKTEIQKCGDDK